MPSDTLTPLPSEPPPPASDEVPPLADPQPAADGPPDASPIATPVRPAGRSPRASPVQAVEDPMTGREIALSIALILFGIAFTAAVVYVYLVYL